MRVVEQMLSRYPADERRHALREVMQEIALAGLQRAGFFEKAAFYGGTCLRIFHGLPRFSEDLDFSLLSPQPGFSLAPYFKALREEFHAFGFEVHIAERQKAAASQEVSAFLKENTSIYDVRVASQPQLKIKFEVDTNPPGGFATQQQLLVQPYSFYASCFALPDLYAGKLHALLFRRWKNRVKGRDWFDFEWYVQQGTALHLQHLAERARQSGDWHQPVLSRDDLMALLRARIASLDVQAAKQDVLPFVRTPEAWQFGRRTIFWRLRKRWCAPLLWRSPAFFGSDATLPMRWRCRGLQRRRLRANGGHYPEPVGGIAVKTAIRCFRGHAVQNGCRSPAFWSEVMPMSENETPSVPDAVLAPLREVLSHFPYVGLAVLFGSVAAGRARADSDLDVAVSAGRSLTAPEMLQMTQALAEKTGRPVDLIDLASVSAPLLGQIVQHGKRVQGSVAELGQLINRHLVEQADFMPLRNRVLAQRRMAWIGK